MWGGLYDPHSSEDLAAKKEGSYEREKMDFVNLHTRRARTSNKDYTTPTTVLQSRAEGEWIARFRGGNSKKRKVKSAAELAAYMKPLPDGPGMLLVLFCYLLALAVYVSSLYII